MTGHGDLQRAIRLNLLQAADRLRAAASELEDAIEHMDHGEPWASPAASAKLEANIAADHLMTARGMSLVAALASNPLDRVAP